MKNIEEANLSAIRRLNQRGGRFLTVVDLLEAGTLDEKLLKFFLKRLWRGDSFLGAAGPSGTGKTTLMGALLNLIPPGTEILTAERGSPLPDSKSGHSPLYLAHELNDAPYYGYIWGREATRFLKAARDRRIAATLHAESLEGVRKKLTRRPVGLPEEDFSRIDLVFTMKMETRGSRRIRRIDRIYASGKANHRTIFRWDREADEYVRTKQLETENANTDLDVDGFINGLVEEKPEGLAAVRRLLLNELEGTGQN